MRGKAAPKMRKAVRRGSRPSSVDLESAADECLESAADGCRMEDGEQENDLVCGLDDEAGSGDEASSDDEADTSGVRLETRSLSFSQMSRIYGKQKKMGVL